MKILAVEKDLASGKDFKPYLQDEARKVWELYRSGIIRELYFTADSHCAVLILECSGINAANDYLSSLPLVQEGLISFEIRELLPYDGFSRLFEEER